jgi:hypothetical protein
MVAEVMTSVTGHPLGEVNVPQKYGPVVYGEK